MTPPVLTEPTEDDILAMLAFVKADEPSHPYEAFPARRPVWRDPANPAEHTLTFADNLAYRAEQGSDW